jgi:hypothetical protein
MPSSIPSSLCVKQELKTAKGGKLACGKGDVTVYEKKASKTTFNEGYFEIVSESSNKKKDDHVLNQETETYYNTITSGSPNSIRRVAFIIGTITTIVGTL